MTTRTGSPLPPDATRPAAGGRSFPGSVTGSETAPLFGLLLSGGASRRMRQDKALLAYRGEPQLLRAWRLLEGMCERAFVSMREEQRGDGLRDRLPLLPDRYPAIGPMAGILSAQDAFPDAAWLVLACDLPLLDDATLRVLLSARDPAAADAVAFASRFDGLPEPLCAIWEPSSAATLRRGHAAGRHCPRAALAQLRTVLLPSPGAALDNANTPEDAAAASRRLESDA